MARISNLGLDGGFTTMSAYDSKDVSDLNEDARVARATAFFLRQIDLRLSPQGILDIEKNRKQLGRIL